MIPTIPTAPDLSKYLPLTGGTMTDNIVFPQDKGIKLVAGSNIYWTTVGHNTAWNLNQLDQAGAVLHTPIRVGANCTATLKGIGSTFKLNDKPIVTATLSGTTLTLDF